MMSTSKASTCPCTSIKAVANCRIQIRTVPSWLTIPEGVLRALKGLHFTRALQVAWGKLAMIRSKNVRRALAFQLQTKRDCTILNTDGD